MGKKKATKKATASAASPHPSKVWSVFGRLAGTSAAKGADLALSRIWRIGTGRKPPGNPASPEVSAWEAVTWSILAGAGAALTKTLAQRRAALYYQKSTGRIPPQLAKKDG